MSNKRFFSLLHGQSIRVAPNTRIIPTNAFSDLLEGKEIIEKAKEDAALYRHEVEQECVKIKEQAEKKGYEEGFQKWAEHIKRFQEEISSVRNEYTKVLATVALKATQKIVGKAFEMDEKLVLNIVSNALKPVLQHKKITIYVNKADLESLENSRDQLKEQFEAIEALSIRERDDVSTGGCIIETEGGIINAQLDNQWNVLEKAFSQLLSEENLKSTTQTVTENH